MHSGSHQGGQSAHARAGTHYRVNHGLRPDVAPEIADGESVIFEQRLYDILAYIVNVALDGGHHHFEFFGVRRARKTRLYYIERRRGRLRAHQKLGQKHSFVFKLLPYLVEGGDYVVVYDVERGLRFKQFGRALRRPGLETLNYGFFEAARGRRRRRGRLRLNGRGDRRGVLNIPQTAPVVPEQGEATPVCFNHLVRVGVDYGG